MIINLISTPRNVSTALMYAFAKREDMKVVDEPFYAHYLHTSLRQHPMREAIIKSQPTQVHQVLEGIHRLEAQHGMVFVKNMAHHMADIPLDVFKNWSHVFLTRNPRQLIASFVKVIPNPTHRDIGLKEQYRMLQFFQKQGGKPVVLDSGELLKNPELVLARLCRKLGLDMTNAMLKWEKGGIPEDGIWAEHWYASAHASTGFMPYRSDSPELPDHCENLYGESLEYYSEISQLSIKSN